MEQLIEIRATGGQAYEMRNGTRVEYAATIDGQNKRMRALGCPEAVLARINRTRALRSTTPVPVRTKPNSNTSLAQQDAERRRKANKLGYRLAAEADADKLRQSNADAEQKNKDAELKRRMDAASGRICR
jgi:hypothetical protein